MGRHGTTWRMKHRHMYRGWRQKCGAEQCDPEAGTSYFTRSSSMGQSDGGDGNWHMGYLELGLRRGAQEYFLAPNLGVPVGCTQDCAFLRAN